jgi:glutamate mutase epsilon subunit
MREKTIQGIYDFLIANRNQFSSDLEDANVTGAVITHYAQTQGNGVSHVFENSAIGLIESYLSKINEKVLDEDVTHMLQLFKAEALNVPFPPPKDHLFTFIDLFAGIGGFRLANGTKKLKKHIEQILAKYLLEISQKKKQRVSFPMVLIFFVRVFHARHSQ